MFHGAGFAKKQKQGRHKLAAQRDLTLPRQLEKVDIDGAGSTLRRVNPASGRTCSKVRHRPPLFLRALIDSSTGRALD
jgi:hypothetical protein